MDLSSSPKPFKPSFKQIVVQDHNNQPNPKDTSSLTHRAPNFGSHRNDTAANSPNLLNIEEVPVIDENDITDISIFEKLCLIGNTLGESMILKTTILKCVMDW